MSMRIVKSARRTDETEISLTLNLDGSGIYDVDTGCLLYTSYGQGRGDHFKYHRAVCGVSGDSLKGAGPFH